jgi:hypothetical protein
MSSSWGTSWGNFWANAWGTITSVLTPSIAGACEVFSRLAFPTRATDGTPSQTVNSVQIYRTQAVEFAPTMSISHSSVNPTNMNHISQSDSYTTAAASQNTHKVPQNESNPLISTAKDSNFVTDSTVEDL